jgi:glutathione S-transferase
MADLTLTTFDWVPEMPRGFVRDLRVRWALEEAGLPYRVKSVPFRERNAEHFSHQPFGQVPWLTDGDLSIFESGAILLHPRRAERQADARGSARPQRRQGVGVRSARFCRGREPALVLLHVFRRHRRNANAKVF